MEEKWVVSAKRADFYGLGEKCHLDPVLVRLIRNRDVFTENDTEIQGDGRSLAEHKIETFLKGGIGDLHDPALMKDLPKGAEIILTAIREGRKIRIIGDYDIDGIMSSYILDRGFRTLGADADVCIPERVKDGYGLNENLVRQAYEDGVELIVTCDNGIAASSQIALARELGMKAVVTDHHQVPFEENAEGRREILPPAEAVIDPHREGETYPFHGLCGGGVAFKLICYLYDLAGLPDAAGKKADLLEFAAIATVGDIMELKDENRILVKEGIRRLHRTQNPGLLELIRQNSLEPEQIDAYHIGFVIGPCLNASGRLDTALRALHMLQTDDRSEAARLAADLVGLNSSRKEMTLQGTEEATRLVETTELKDDRVLVVYLPDCHESIAGIIAGRIKEKFYRPTFVLTRGEEGLKGSGRSIEGYSMYEELCKCKDLLAKFGGHPMAAGISLKEEDLDAFRRMLNANCELTEDELTPRQTIDVPMPVSYVTETLVDQLEVLKPFGKGNEKPLFAQSGLRVTLPRVMGKNRNVCKMKLVDANGNTVSAIVFGDADEFVRYADSHDTISIIYYPTINTWNGRSELQMNISAYR